MKTLKPTLILIFISLSLLSTAESRFNKSDLIEINSYWEDHNLDIKYFEKLQKLKKYNLIQMHLFLVEKELRSSSISCERTNLLNELHEYAERGQFPINNHHSIRMPYFIDDYGTACAVGHLIIKSSNDDLALRISKGSNYKFLREMEFPEIDVWAKNFGFTEKELMWIQPTYGPACPPDSIRIPTCYNFAGCFNPDVSKDSLISPLQYQLQYLDSGIWKIDSSANWYYYGVTSGIYRLSITDSRNRTVVYNYNMQSLYPEITATYTIKNQTNGNHCNGRITINPTNVHQPNQYGFYILSPYTNLPLTNNNVFDSLCPGKYYLYILDSLRCPSAGVYLDILNSTNINTISPNVLRLSPNPFTNYLTLDFGNNQSVVRIYNINGKLVFFDNNYNSTIINTSEFSKGIYILEVSNSSGSIRKKIIKSN